jgi:uncharacterized membrane protein YczE
MKNILLIKKIPTVSWSSHHPLNFTPRPLTLVFLCMGLMIFGIGEALLINSHLGVSPWTVLAQGVSLSTSQSIGWSTFYISIVVLSLWLPLKQAPGIGTLLNAIIIAASIELSLPLLPKPATFEFQLLQSMLGIFVVGFGSGIYLIAHLGAGPRDGLMTGLQRISELPMAWVRTIIELIVVITGWLLGGTVGIGTLLFAIVIGPAVSLGLATVKYAFQSAENGE